MTATAQDQPALDPLTPNHLAWCLTAAGGSYEWVEVAGQPLGPTDVAIRPRSSALNHMDLWLTRGKTLTSLVPARRRWGWSGNRHRDRRRGFNRCGR